MDYFLQLWEIYHFYTTNTDPPKRSTPAPWPWTIRSGPFLGANIVLPQVLKKNIFIRNGLKIHLFWGRGVQVHKMPFFKKNVCILKNTTMLLMS